MDWHSVSPVEKNDERKLLLYDMCATLQSGTQHLLLARWQGSVHLRGGCSIGRVSFSQKYIGKLWKLSWLLCFLLWPEWVMWESVVWRESSSGVTLCTLERAVSVVLRRWWHWKCYYWTSDCGREFPIAQRGRERSARSWQLLPRNSSTCVRTCAEPSSLCSGKAVARLGVGEGSSSARGAGIEIIWFCCCTGWGWRGAAAARSWGVRRTARRIMNWERQWKGAKKGERERQAEWWIWPAVVSFVSRIHTY